jgi:hypothetical protein
MKLTEKETAALQAIVNEGLECMGGKTAADLLDDNMSWFVAEDLMRRLSINHHEAAGIMSALEKKGIAMDSMETPNNKPGPTHWYLTGDGIELAASLDM